MSTSKVLIVVVLYETESTRPAADSMTLRCISSAFKLHPELANIYDLLLWDNSPQSTISFHIAIPHNYRKAATNDGVAGAYNGALAECIRVGYTWMLLLDDDTEVSADYLLGMLGHIDHCMENQTIAAIAPVLYDKDFQLSPQRVLRHRNVPVSSGTSRILEEECFAANSGVTMRTAALAEIGGYSLDFWLDYSDIYVFHRLYAAGKRLYLAADLHLQHSMTMLDYDGRMTPARYTNFLYAEQAFFDLYRDPVQSYIQILRMAARVIRQRRFRSKAFSRLTLKFLLRRLGTSKQQRLHEWSQQRATRRTIAAAGKA